eukprot:gi/632956464/ref/XP_007893971.1/ PREDICTED: NXPE family member 3-like isoform X2 [Callorhinchus milii]
MKNVPWILRLINCGYKNRSFTYEERNEEMFLMKMIEWPKPFQARTPFLESTDPSHSHFLILNSQNTFHVGDQLQVMVHMHDFVGHPKQYGGDYLQARIHTPELKAGSVGTVNDYQNGSYKINFTLFWSGKVEVSVTLVYPSEAIQVFERLQVENPDRVYFAGTFRSGNTTEITVCNLCLPDIVPLCNFTDLRTGEPWFCYKPHNLPCSTRISHSIGGYHSNLYNEEYPYFESIAKIMEPILPKGPGYVTVEALSHSAEPAVVRLEMERKVQDQEGKPRDAHGMEPQNPYLQSPQQESTSSVTHFSAVTAVAASVPSEGLQNASGFSGKEKEVMGANLGPCVRGKSLTSPSGFYYKDQWMSTTCNIRHFNTPANITNCLWDKVVHFLGDSTIRQWFEYLIEFLPGLRQFDLGNDKKIGPHLAVDIENNIIVTFRLHGPPLRSTDLSTHEMQYIANELDRMKGGNKTIIAITIWAHLSNYPVEVYIRRLQIIRKSILQLLSRNPDTQVVIKSANVREVEYKSSIFLNDWISFQFDLVLKKMFKGVNVAFVDAWEMTVAHYLPHDIHPQRIIVKNEVDAFLSYVCPCDQVKNAVSGHLQPMFSQA